MVGQLSVNGRVSPAGARSINFIELFRLVAACAVVLTHVNMIAFLFDVPPAWWAIAICAATKFSVPTFMVVASFLHTKSYEKYEEFPRLSAVLRKKWYALFIPYFIWNIIYLSTANQTLQIPALTAGNLWGLIMGQEHLYFISILFQFYLVFHLYFSKTKSKSFVKPFLICAALSFSFYIVSEVVLWTFGPDENLFEWYIGNAIVGWGIYFAWGVLLAKVPKILKFIEAQTLLLIALTLTAYVFYFLEILYEYQETQAFARLFFLISGFFYQFLAGNTVLSLCLRFSRRFAGTKILAYITSLGKNTFGIYLAHMFFIYVWVGIFKSVGLVAPAPLLIAAFLLTIVSSVLLEKFFRSYVPALGALLFGSTRKPSMKPSKVLSTLPN